MARNPLRGSDYECWRKSEIASERERARKTTDVCMQRASKTGPLTKNLLPVTKQALDVHSTATYSTGGELHLA